MSLRWIGGCALALVLGAGTVGAQDESARRDLLSPLQHVNLASGGGWWLAVAGQARWRGESWTGYNFGAPATADPNDAYSLGRFFLSLDLHAGNALRVLVEGKSSLASDRTLVGGRRTSDEDALDLHQGYAEVTIPGTGAATVQLRAGRQELILGRERLVSQSDWSNARRTFDGVTGRLAVGGWSVVGIGAAPVLVQSYAFNRRDPHTLLYGAYASNPKVASHVGLDLYWLGLERDSVTINGTTGRERRQTFGTRLFGAAGAVGADYEADLTWQVGTVGAASIGAWQGATLVGYTLAGVPAARFYVGVDYASGDATPGGRVGTFNELFGTAHRYHGYMDVNGGQNLLDLSAGASLKWRGVTAVALDAHHFDRASRSDAFYSATLAVTRAAGSGLAGHLGDELDLTCRYPAGRHMLLMAGVSRYFPGAFVRQTGSSRSITYTYFSSQLTL